MLRERTLAFMSPLTFLSAAWTFMTGRVRHRFSASLAIWVVTPRLPAVAALGLFLKTLSCHASLLKTARSQRSLAQSLQGRSVPSFSMLDWERFCCTRLSISSCRRRNFLCTFVMTRKSSPTSCTDLFSWQPQPRSCSTLGDLQSERHRLSYTEALKGAYLGQVVDCPPEGRLRHLQRPQLPP